MNINQPNIKTSDSKIEKQLENMRNAVIDAQRCKEIALKLTEYIKKQ